MCVTTAGKTETSASGRRPTEERQPDQGSITAGKWLWKN